MSSLTYMQEIYEQLHRQPELSLKEFWTADFVAAELSKLGFEVLTNLGGTGVLGLLEFERPGPTLALRADMDALPVQEETKVAYASQNPGVMHACGHDSHMAILLGGCRAASRNKERLAGRLMAIFQPAEEIVVGAQAMLDDGIFARHKPERVVGIHNWPSLEAGTIGLQSGPITAFADGFQVAFRGEGGHGALPHKTKDPIAMASAGIQNVFSLTQRRSDPLFPQVVSFGLIHGGSSFNVIPDSVLVEGTVRTTRREDQAETIKLLHQAFAAAASLYGGEYRLEYRKGVPAVVNDPRVVAELQEFFQSEIPEVPVCNQGLASLIGEDMAYFLQAVPGVLLLIGSGQAGAVNELHRSSFLVPSKTLQTGYQALTAIVGRYLGMNTEV